MVTRNTLRNMTLSLILLCQQIIELLFEVAVWHLTCIWVLPRRDGLSENDPDVDSKSLLYLRVRIQSNKIVLPEYMVLMLCNLNFYSTYES